MTGLYINDSAELAELCDTARNDSRIGIDTEFHRERRYFPQLALVQLVVSNRAVLLDPLGSVDLAPLGEVLADADIVKVLHAPAQDLEIFYMRFERNTRNVFDTQTAAAMLGMGTQISLGGLVERLLGVRLVKGESFTDWMRRPLTEKQERYALEDVLHLFGLHDELRSRLGALGRNEWVIEECLAFESPSLFEPDPNKLYRKVKRYRTLDARGLGVLNELANWRENTARNNDRNRRAIAGDEVLLELARSKPKNLKTLGRTRGLHSQALERDGAAILAAIEAGLGLTPEQLPAVASKAPLSEAAEMAAGMVHAFLKVYCRELAIDVSMISTVAQTESLVARFLEDDLQPGSAPMLRGWRGELVGERVLAFLRGEIAMRMDPATGAPKFEAVSS